MPLPWLQLIDAALGIANFARGRKAPPQPAEPELQLDASGRAAGGLEARLAGVVVVALKEAFDRDSRRIELEREQLAAEHERAERVLQLELLRQAGDREIGRLRLLAGVAGAAWIGTLALSARLLGGGLGARVSLASGWLLLLGAIAASFAAQSRAAAVVDELANGDTSRQSAVRSGASRALALWLTVCGLALVGLAALLA